MAYCTKCGTQVAEGVKFCTSCGFPMGVVQQPPPPQEPKPQAAPQQPQQTYQQSPQQPYQQPYQQPVYTEEPISTGGYIGLFLLLMIPIVNLVCLIVWACGGSNKKNKVNLSRALLVWMLIGTIIGGIVVLAGGMLFGDSINELMEIGNGLKDIQ
ncbi:MAG: zinc ribbon domain-containing protein [Parabacteroides sp.]|nr:zinc ribbon domain-containing protein [Parabacteroides sp.]